MTDNVVSLHQTPIQHDIVAGLRNLADKLEQEGPVAYDMPAVTTVVVVLGHSSTKLLPNGEIEHCIHHERFTWGPRNDGLTSRGLLATAVNYRGD